MGNSNALFVGLIIVLFGYLGWLLKNIYEQVKFLEKERDDNREILNIIREKIDKLDESIYRDILNKLNDNLTFLKKINSQLENSNQEQEDLQKNIVSEIKEESNEIKEIIKILLSRSFIMKEQRDKNNEDEKNRE